MPFSFATTSSAYSCGGFSQKGTLQESTLSSPCAYHCPSWFAEGRRVADGIPEGKIVDRTHHHRGSRFESIDRETMAATVPEDSAGGQGGRRL